MKKLVFALFLCPFITNAQKLLPRFENDTLYTTCGYKIYAGDTLHISGGAGEEGNFRFIKVKTASISPELTNNRIIVKQLDDFTVSGLGNAYITVKGTIIYENGKSGRITIRMAFDRAIESFPGLPSELIVPEEFRNKPKGSVADEINKLYKLYKEGVLTKEEFETQKKKLLAQ